MANPPFHLLELRFRVLKPVNDLPHFHGAQWSALLRHLLRPHLPGGSSLADGGILIQTVESGITAYEVNDLVHLGLVVPPPVFPAVRFMLTEFAKSPATAGHFQPGVTIALEQIACRFCGGDCLDNPCLLNDHHLAPEIELLSRLDSFSLELTAPLRLPRPGGTKGEGHAFLDESYLFGADRNAPLNRILEKIRSPEETSAGDLLITGGAVTWVEVPYGGQAGKTLGGVSGTIRVAGRPSPELARRLVLGQYLGAGKNGAFGLGFYTIPELDGVRNIRPLTRGRSFLHRAATLHGDLVRAAAHTLTPALDRLLSSSAYAYRRGLSHKNGATILKRLLADGYTMGIKADISAFFPWVNCAALGDLLAGLFPAEPLVGRIHQWLEQFAGNGIFGLPQGWGLSPVLSSLFLDRFDGELAREKFRLIRYGDAFVVLSRDGLGEDVGVGIMIASLGRLGLRFHPDKGEQLRSNPPLRLIGYLTDSAL